MFSVRKIFDKYIGNKQKGFTLIELMIALLILSVLMTAVYRVFISQERMFRTHDQVSALQENLRATIEYVNQELTWMGYQVPGLAVITAAETDLIFKANIPNTGATIQYVRYTFDPSTNTISRAAGSATSDVESADLTVMANDIASLSFSYINVLNGVVIATDADPLIASELGGTDNASLQMIQRIKARVTARTSKPDWEYTHPASPSDYPWGGGNYRTRSAVLDLKARNAEDVTLQGGHVGLGECGTLEHTITVPGGVYYACPDKVAILGGGAPDLSDNPYVTIIAKDKDGNINTNSNRTTYVYASAGDGSPYNMYDNSDPWTQDNVIDTNETRYVSAMDLSNVSAGETVTLNFGYVDGICTQVNYQGSTSIIVAPIAASQLNSTSPYGTNGITYEYVDLTTGNPSSPQPSNLAVCSTQSNEGIQFGILLEDACGNDIGGESVTWDDNGAGGTFSDVSDVGDGTYIATYVPNNTMPSYVSQDTIIVDANWGGSPYSQGINIVPAPGTDIVVNSIDGPVDGGGSPLYGFASDGYSSFEIERVSNQVVTINFSVVDDCGNRVFDRASYLNVSQNTPGYGTVSSVTAETDGTYTATWTSNFGCGPEVNNLDIEIVDIGISGGNGTETIAYNLNASTEPVLNLSVTKGGFPVELTAGCTDDELLVTATIQEYDSATEECSNVPGPFPVTFSVSGKNGASLGNGSFDHGDLSDTDIGITSDPGGIATVMLNPGTSRKGQILVVSANVDIEGATYAQMDLEIDRQVIITTTEPGFGSGFYEGSTGTSQRIGLSAPSIWSESPPSTPSDRSYDMGDDIWMQIDDCDENEDVYYPDGNGSPKVEVLLSSNLSGDAVTVELIETGANTASFRNVTGIPTVNSSTAIPGDGNLQTGYGDLVTMSYIDNDDFSPTFPLQVFISGTREVKLFKVVDTGDLSQDLDIVPGASQITISDGDLIRPRIYVPEYGGVGGNDSITATISAVTSPGETDIATFTEIANDGYFYLDAGGRNYFQISSITNPGSIHDDAWLEMAFTPQTVTLSHSTRSITIEVADSTDPDVNISSPVTGSTESGVITITVNASDNQGYAPAPVGIDRIDVFINGILLERREPGTDLTPSQDFTWTTASGGSIYWLNGNYTVYAVAYDLAGNTTTSSAIVINVNNPINIWFTLPTVTGASDNIFNHQTLTVGLQTAPLGTTGISVALAMDDGSGYSGKPLTGSNPYSFDWDTSLESDGAFTFLATLNDGRGNTRSVTLNLIVDSTSPSISLLPPALSITNGFYRDSHFPITWQYTVTDSNYLDSSSTSNMTISGTDNNISQAGIWNNTAISGGNYINTYTVSWSGPSAGYEGSADIAITADDSSQTPNTGTFSSTINIDRVDPTVDVPVISGATGSYVKGTVTVYTGVNDTYADGGWVGINPYSGGTWYFKTPDGSGNFSHSWNTLLWSNGTYQVHVAGRDLASNFNNYANDFWIYYVDNGVPDISPVPSLPVAAYVTSVVPVTFDYNANYGLLASTGLVYRDSGYSIIGSDIVAHPLVSAIATTRITTIMDTRDFANGLNYLIASAADHAQNVQTVEYDTQVCNRELQLTSIVRDPTPPRANGDVQIVGSLVQNTSSGPQGPPAGGWAITVDVDNTVNGSLLPLSWQETFNVTNADGSFLVITTRDNLKNGDDIVVTVTNTDSGCAAYFESLPLDMIEKSLSGTM